MPDIFSVGTLLCCVTPISISSGSIISYRRGAMTFHWRLKKTYCELLSLPDAEQLVMTLLVRKRFFEFIHPLYHFPLAPTQIPVQQFVQLNLLFVVLYSDVYSYF